jgi:hypothetical protein
LPHGRLQEWVAEEQGYFTAEGLEYTFLPEGDSGSHFATAQALEAVLAPEQATLTFQGPPNERLDALLDRQVPAATLFGVPLYIAEPSTSARSSTPRS